MRILMVAPGPVFPVNNGSRARNLALINHLRSSGHHVEYLSYRQLPGDETKSRTFLHGKFHAMGSSWTRLNRGGLRGLFQLGAQAYFGNHYPLALDYWCDEKMSDHARRIVLDRNIDTVLVEYVFLSRLLEDLPPHVLKIIDTHDRFTGRANYLNARGIRQPWFHTSEADEARGLDRADRVISLSDEDKDNFSRISKRPVFRVGHLFGSPKPLPPTASSNQILIFSSKNAINVDSTLWFLGSVLPHVRKTYPNIEVTLAGSIGAKFRRTKHIRVIPQVSQPKDLYETHAIAVNPSRALTGLSIKSVEALGYGRALISTPSGITGLASGKGSAFLVGGDAEELASHIISVIHDDETRQRLQNGALEFMHNYEKENLAQLEAALCH